MAGMEIASWATCFFLILYAIADRFNKKRNLEIHTLGVELPLLGFIFIVVLGLRINAPQSDFITDLGMLRNLILLFVFAYAFQVIKNLNRLTTILWVFATVIAVYGIWQHFTGIDLWRQSHRALMEVPWGGGGAYSTVGFFSHHLTYGHSYMMILCLPWAALLLARSRTPWWQIALFVISFSLILVSLIFTYGRGVWIAVIATLPIMAFFSSRKLFFTTLIIVALAGGAVLKFNPLLRERTMSIFAENVASNEDRKHLWEANIEMFHDHPWIGVGYHENEPLSETYFKKLGIENGMAGHAHSNYVQALSTTGILGFSFYMIFILAFVLMTARLFSTIPATHYWHRVFALTALGAQLSFHIGGLTQWNFGDSEVQHQFIFWLAIVAYMNQQYYGHIVPDDHSL